MRRRRWPEYQDAYRRFAALVRASGPDNPVLRVTDVLAKVGWAGRSSMDKAAMRIAAEGLPKRPLYTDRELAALWPLICRAVLGMRHGGHPDAATLAAKLSKAGLQPLQGHRGNRFWQHGQAVHWFPVCHLDRFEGRKWTQAEIEQALSWR